VTLQSIHLQYCKSNKSFRFRRSSLIRLMKTQTPPIRKIADHPRGFALVVTLTLMILLSILAIGMLSLSSVALRNTGNSDNSQVARANAVQW